MISLKDFDKLLQSHDWNYFLSHDTVRYFSGKKEAEKIVKILAAADSEKYNNLYRKYQKNKHKYLDLN